MLKENGMNTPLKIMGGIVAIAAFLAVVYKVDSRWVQCPVYAAEKSVVQKRLDVIEQKAIMSSIDDKEDRLDNPKLSAERKGKLKEQIRRLKMDLKEIGGDNTTKGGR